MIHLPRGDETVAFAHQPLPFQEKHTGKRNGEDIKRCISIGESVSPYQGGMPHKGPATERCGRGRQYKYPDVELAAGNEVVGSFLGLQVTGDTNGDAVSPVQKDEKE